MRGQLTVGELIEKLREFPADAQVYAYEGEVTGLAIGEIGKLGFICAYEWREHDGLRSD